jgi:adenylosuccinate synthase
MSIEVVVGCQWGDEGKGKVVQLLSQGKNWVARFQGGANAGHTIFVAGRRMVLHQIPTGIIEPAVRCAIGNGVVLDPLALVGEIGELEALGIDVGDRLRLSPFTHLVTRLHKAAETLDAHDSAIGTTRRGIGPAYSEKASRTGMRVEDLTAPVVLEEKLRLYWERLKSGSRLDDAGLARAAGADFGTVLSELLSTRSRLAPMIADVTEILLAADDRGESILCEGAQGALLDIDHGTYPFVTSSNTTVGGACTGLGIPPGRISRVIGVVKAYTTRVGLGPFPTEMDEDSAARFREQAGEYGATTGRPRRCGWFDAVLARRCCRINGVDELLVTKLDVLSGLPEIRIARAYGPATAGTGAHASAEGWLSTRALETAVPDYETHAGWSEDLGKLLVHSALPAATRKYLERLASLSGARVGRVSVGPGRDQVITLAS